MKKFVDRTQAGISLAKILHDFTNRPDVIILALPRGGVPVAYEISTALAVPLDILVVRKLGVPEQEELAMGAVAFGGTVFLNEPLIRQLNIKKSSISAVLQAEQEELARRERLYRGERPFPDLLGKTIILVDDGIATGSTMRAAVEALRNHKPSAIIIAVPVAADSTCKDLAKLVDKIVCPLRPADFYAVGLWYEHFPQTSDEEIIKLLKPIS